MAKTLDECLKDTRQIVNEMSNDQLQDMLDEAVLAEWLLNPVRCSTCHRIINSGTICPHEEGIETSNALVEDEEEDEDEEEPSIEEMESNPTCPEDNLFTQVQRTKEEYYEQFQIDGYLKGNHLLGSCLSCHDKQNYTCQALCKIESYCKRLKAESLQSREAIAEKVGEIQRQLIRLREVKEVLHQVDKAIKAVEQDEL